MFKKGSTNLVLIAAVVSVVALAGMVFFTPSSNSGAQTIVLPAFDDLLTQRTGRASTDYAAYEEGWEAGLLVTQECLAKGEEVQQCCSRLCPDACSDPTEKRCREKCKNVCQNQASQEQGLYLRTR